MPMEKFKVPQEYFKPLIPLNCLKVIFVEMPFSRQLQIPTHVCLITNNSIEISFEFALFRHWPFLLALNIFRFAYHSLLPFN